ncbi:MAG: sensor histidine kinase, partial [Proteobacteria bacterium]|nr:sensor histidine kinase [Pseudomonadota bacterium]
KYTRTWFDLILILVISLTTLVLAVFLDLYEVLFYWSRQYDWFEIDELIITTLVFFPGLVWFSYRRWKEATHALLTSLDIQARLEKTEKQKTETLKENRRLINRISDIQEMERKQIATDLHDIFGQHLTAIHANATTIQSALKEDERLDKITGNIITSALQLGRLTRLILHELRPTVLDKIGLDGALDNMVSEWKENNPDYEISFSSNGSDEDVDKSISLAIYRSVQEALTNVVKHSAGTQVSIFIDYQSLGEDDTDNWIFLLFSDDGRGFIHPSETEGLGLIGIRERINNLDGSFEIVTEPGKGTELSIMIPRITSHKP